MSLKFKKIFKTVIGGFFMTGALAVPQILMTSQSRADVICKEEADKFCPGKEWGEGLDDCLKAHHRELSNDCRHHVEEIKVKSIEKDPEAHKRSGASCKDDRDQFCRGERGSKMWKCLKTHHDELTQDCQGLVDKRFRKRATE